MGGRHQLRLEEDDGLRGPEEPGRDVLHELDPAEPVLHQLVPQGAPTPIGRRPAPPSVHSHRGPTSPARFVRLRPCTKFRSAARTTRTRPSRTRCKKSFTSCRPATSPSVRSMRGAGAHGTEGTNADVTARRASWRQRRHRHDRAHQVVWLGRRRVVHAARRARVQPGAVRQPGEQDEGTPPVRR